jgi:hypothetical protein
LLNVSSRWGIFALARNESAGEHLRFGGKSVIVRMRPNLTGPGPAGFLPPALKPRGVYRRRDQRRVSGYRSQRPVCAGAGRAAGGAGREPVRAGDYRNRNVIAVPNSLTSQLLTALKPLIDDGGLSRISVTSLLSASAHGKKAVDALAGQSAKLLNGIPIDEDDFFGRQLAFNMLPLLPDREGSVREERRIVDEARKILQDDGLMISANVVQSPVFYGHAQMVSFEAMRPLAAEEARDAFTRGEDIELSEEGEFPTRLAMPPVARISPSAACITITVCRSRFSSGPLPITCASAAR